MAFDSIELIKFGDLPAQESVESTDEIALESLYTSYEDFRLYQAQRPISLPKSGNGKSSGKGSLVYLLSPNMKSTMELLKSSEIGFRQGTYKSWTSDVVFKGKIGQKMVNKNNRAAILTEVNEDKELNKRFTFYPPNTVNTVKTQYKNLIVDLSTWLELFFNRKPNSVQKLCEYFIKLMNQLLVSEDGYSNVVLFDLNSWCKSSECIIMNKKLLNDPLSIFFYTAYYYPDIWNNMSNVRIIVANRSEKQCVLFNTKDLNKKSYTNIKNRMRQMKDVVFSAEDETSADSEISDAEVKAEIVNDFKKEMKQTLQNEVEGKSIAAPNPFDKPIDITAEIVEDEKTYAEEEGDNNGSGVGDSSSDDVSELSPDVIGKTVDDYVAENPDVIFGDPIGTAEKVSTRVKKNIYLSSFMPPRSEEEIEKIKRMTNNQANVLKLPSIDEVKKKEIDVTQFSNNIGLNNPNISSSKFTNFDKNYVEKCLTSDIDNAIGALSQADKKIFITKKEVIDTSTPMDLKETWVYYLEDETGNKKVLKLDVPKVIDGTYVYLNGGLKIIGHQFVLKPIVKSGPDCVQLVTAYNKVFIYRRGQFDNNTNNVIVYLQKNPGKFQVKLGNFTMMNQKYEIPLDFYMMSRYFGSFKVGNIKFFMDIDELMKYVDTHYASKKREINFSKEIPVGIDMKTHEIKVLPLDQSYTDELLRCFSQEDVNNIAKIKRKPKLIVAEMKIFKRFVPVIIFALFCEGFKSVMTKAKIDYKFVDREEAKKLNYMLWGKMQLEDCVLVWRKKNIAVSLLMNGLNKCPLENFTAEELESKDTYIALISHFFNDDQRVAQTMNQYRDFMIDPKTAEILKDFGYPTDLVQLLLTAVNLLADSKYLPENNMANMRVRSAEVIADIAYRLITQCYETYRKQNTKKNPFKGFELKQTALIDGLLRSSDNSSKGKKREVVTNLVTEASVLNPILEMDKRREVTFKGLGGIQLDRAMTVARRAYDKSMLGSVGITTSPDSNVGVVRELTLEPNITSTRGYIDTSNQDDPDKLNAAQLFTFSELTTPLGVTADDPDRTAMCKKQTKYQISIEDASPVLIGNGVEKIAPYVLSDEFVVDAKEDGKVIDIDGGYCIVEYKSGKRYAIDIAPRVKKNSSAGFYVDNTLKCDLQIGDKFKKGDVLAYNAKQFTKHVNDNGASMDLGVLSKVAIVSSWDIYEDSAPITKKLSERLATEMINDRPVVFDNPSNTIVDYIVKVGDKVKTGDPLIKFGKALSDEMQNLYNSLRDQSSLDEISEDVKTVIKTKYTGEVVDIKMYTTVPIEDMDPSLQKIFKDYNKRINKRNKVLDKYKNEGDLNFYKAGQIISEVPNEVTPSKNGKVKGEYLESGVLIIFYVKYRDIAAKGDKVAANFALKGVCSHVIEEGFEPYSEYRPDEEISALVAPLSVAARKVPSIFLAMFGNKCLIEAKNQLKEIWES